MSILARFAIALVIGLGAFFTYLHFNKKEDKIADLNKRFQRLENESLSYPAETVSKLQTILKEDELLEGEWLLLFELLTESAIHSHSPYITYLNDKIANSPSVDWQITDACASYRDGNISGASNSLRQLITDYPSHRRANYEFHRIQFLIGGMDERIGAKLALKSLSKEEDRWAYKALRVLAFTPPRPGIMKQDLVAALEDLRIHQRVVSADFIRASEILYRIESNKQPEQIFEEMLTLGKGRVNPNDFGYWLITTGQPEMALRIIPQTNALSSEAAFMIRFQALLENNQSRGAQELLGKATHLSREKILRAEAYLSLAKGQKNTIEDFLSDAKELNSVESFLDVARLALLGGNGSIAYESFQKAWALAPEKFPLSSANQFLQISLNSRNTKEAHQITSVIKQKNPEKFGNANNHCYLSLLIGENVESLEKEALRICNAFPGNPSFLSTLALAKLMGGKSEEALEVMRNRGPVPLLQGEKALLACILTASGKKDDAEKVATGLEEMRMLPEEWALLRKHNLVMAQ